jgi:predicted ABC-type transport system involved in lysophospholipase L1 biosynthesis ATPase subunit
MSLAWLARRRAQGTAIVFAVHDAVAAERVADRTLRLHEGLLQPARLPRAQVAERAWR